MLITISFNENDLFRRPCFIFRHPRSSTASTNIFLRPFETTVWLSIICVVVLSGFVYCTIMHYESNQTFSPRMLSDIVLLKIGTLCQQGTIIEIMLTLYSITILIILFCSIISCDNDYKIQCGCVISYNYSLKRILLSHITFLSLKRIFLDMLFDMYLYVLFLGTVMEPTKLSNRLIVLLMFVFSLVTYQFYSSSIVSGLLRPTVMNIDSVQKLEESGLDVGVEDFNVITKVIEVRILLNCILYCKIVLKS